MGIVLFYPDFKKSSKPSVPFGHLMSFHFQLALRRMKTTNILHLAPQDWSHFPFIADIFAYFGAFAGGTV